MPEPVSFRGKALDIVLYVLLLIASFLLVGVVTDRYFIPSLENIARWLKLSESVAGATLLAFGSSAPELFTALLTMVILGSQPSFGVGSIIGSALFQILVVIGFAATVKTTYLRWRPVIRDGGVYAVAVVVLYLFVQDGTFTRTEGILFVGCYLLYLVGLVFWSKYLPPQKKREGPEVRDGGKSLDRTLSVLKIPMRPVEMLLKPIPDPGERPRWTFPVFFLSLILIGLGTWGFVRAGTAIAESLGIDPTIVALTIIAGGTSVPELFSSAIVARRGQGDMAIANALGSNTFDIFVSLGLPVLIATLIHGDIQEVGGANITSSTILLFATLLMVIGLLAVQKFKASRPFGILLILSYGVYVLAAYSGWIK